MGEYKEGSVQKLFKVKKIIGEYDLIRTLSIWPVEAGDSPRSFQSRPKCNLEAGVKERQTLRVFF